MFLITLNASHIKKDSLHIYLSTINNKDNIEKQTGCFFS